MPPFGQDSQKLTRGQRKRLVRQQVRNQGIVRRRQARRVQHQRNLGSLTGPIHGRKAPDITDVSRAVSRAKVKGNRVVLPSKRDRAVIRQFVNRKRSTALTITRNQLESLHGPEFVRDVTKRDLTNPRFLRTWMDPAWGRRKSFAQEAFRPLTKPLFKIPLGYGFKRRGSLSVSGADLATLAVGGPITGAIGRGAVRLGLRTLARGTGGRASTALGGRAGAELMRFQRGTLPRRLIGGGMRGALIGSVAAEVPGAVAHAQPRRFTRALRGEGVAAKGLARLGGPQEGKATPGNIGLNLIKDAINLPANVIPMIYLPAEAIGQAALSGDSRRLDQLIEDFKNSDAIALLLQGRFGEAGRAAATHPLWTALEFGGGLGAAGRIGGFAAHHTGRRRYGAPVIGDPAYRPLGLGGKVQMYSPNYILSSLQRRRDIRHERLRERSEADPRGKAARKVERIVRRQGRERTWGIRGQAATSKAARSAEIIGTMDEVARLGGMDIGPVVGMAIERTARPYSVEQFAADLNHIKSTYISERGNMTPDELAVQETQIAAIDEALANLPESFERASAAAQKFIEDQTPAEAALIQARVLAQKRASRARALPAMFMHEGARRRTPEQTKKAVRDFLQDAEADLHAARADLRRSRKGVKTARRRLNDARQKAGKLGRPDKEGVVIKGGTARGPASAAARAKRVREAQDNLAEAQVLRDIATVTLRDARGALKQRRQTASRFTERIEVPRDRPAGTTLYHGTEATVEGQLRPGAGVFGTAIYAGAKRQHAHGYGPNIHEVVIDPDMRVADLSDPRNRSLKDAIQSDPENAGRIAAAAGFDAVKQSVNWPAKSEVYAIYNRDKVATRKEVLVEKDLDDMGPDIVQDLMETTDWVPPEWRDTDAGFLSHVGDRPPVVTPSPFMQPPGVPATPRTGRSTRTGSIDLGYEQQLRTRLRQAYVAAEANAYAKWTQNSPSFRTIEEAATAMRDPAWRVRLGGAPRIVRKDINHPLAARFDDAERALDDGIGLSEDQIMDLLDQGSMVEKAMTDASGPGVWTLKSEHEVRDWIELTRTGQAGDIESVVGVWKSAILPTSPGWYAGNFIDTAIRAVSVGLPPPLIAQLGRRNRQGRALIDELGQAGEGIVPGGFLSAAMDARAGGVRPKRRGTRIFERATQRDIQDLTGLPRALATMRRAPVARNFVNVYKAFSDAMFAANRLWVEAPPQVAGLGRIHSQHVKNVARAQGKTIKIGSDAWKDMVEGKVGTDMQLAYARELQKTFGNWNMLSPKGKQFLVNYAPFMLWARAAARFVTVTMPLHHPGTTGLISAAAQMTDVERKILGFDLFYKQGSKGKDFLAPVPGYQQGGIPIGEQSEQGSRTIIPTSNLTSFGVFANGPLGFATFLVPSIQNVLFSGKGLAWFGAELKHADGTKLDPWEITQYGVASSVEAFIPFLPLARRLGAYSLPGEPGEKSDVLGVLPFGRRVPREKVETGRYYGAWPIGSKNRPKEPASVRQKRKRSLRNNSNSGSGGPWGGGGSSSGGVKW